MNLVLKLAQYMASYEHHSGYPRYDGGHTQPEDCCQHENCKSVREFIENNLTLEELKILDTWLSYQALPYDNYELQRIVKKIGRLVNEPS